MGWFEDLTDWLTGGLSPGGYRPSGPPRPSSGPSRPPARVPGASRSEWRLDPVEQRGLVSRGEYDRSYNALGRTVAPSVWSNFRSDQRAGSWARQEYNQQYLAGLVASQQNAVDLQRRYAQQADADRAAQDKYRRDQQAREDARENADRQSAYDAMQQDFMDLGLDGGEIMAAFKKLGRDGWRNDTLLLRTVRETKTYAQRFGSVMQARKKNGLPALSEADIVGLERDYRRALSQYGLPAGFYDSPSDFANWIANDVSPSEVAARASMASDAVNTLDDATRAAFKEYYGVGSGDLTAYFLDRGKAVDLLTKQVKAAQFGAEVSASGLSVDRGTLEDFAGKGLERSAVRSAADTVASTADDWRRLAQMGGEQLTQQSLLKSALNMDAATNKKIMKLASQERGRFGGSTGGTAALGRSITGQV